VVARFTAVLLQERDEVRLRSAASMVDEIKAIQPLGFTAIAFQRTCSSSVESEQKQSAST